MGEGEEEEGGRGLVRASFEYRVEQLDRVVDLGEEVAVGEDAATGSAAVRPFVNAAGLW